MQYVSKLTPDEFRSLPLGTIFWVPSYWRGKLVDVQRFKLVRVVLPGEPDFEAPLNMTFEEGTAYVHIFESRENFTKMIMNFRADTDGVLRPWRDRKSIGDLFNQGHGVWLLESECRHHVETVPWPYGRDRELWHEEFEESMRDMESEHLDDDDDFFSDWEEGEEI